MFWKIFYFFQIFWNVLSFSDGILDNCRSKISSTCCDRPRESVLEPLKIVIFEIFSNVILLGTTWRVIIIFYSTCKWNVIFNIFDNLGPSEYSTPLRDERFVTHKSRFYLPSPKIGVEPYFRIEILEKKQNLKFSKKLSRMILVMF